MPATRYLEILSVQRPLAFAVDTSNRIMFTCNYQATAAAPVHKLEEEICRLIIDANLGTFRLDLFFGPAAQLPKDTGLPLTTVVNTGGVAPLETHDGSKYERVTFQITTRAVSYVVARDRAMAIWRLLDGLREVEVTAA